MAYGVVANVWPMWICRYGVYTYGLCSYGLCRYGLRSFGLCINGLRSYGLCRYGLRSYGLCRYGLCRYGLCSYDLRRYGLCSYGLCSYGLRERRRDLPDERVDLLLRADDVAHELARRCRLDCQDGERPYVDRRSWARQQRLGRHVEQRPRTYIVMALWSYGPYMVWPYIVVVSDAM